MFVVAVWKVELDSWCVEGMSTACQEFSKSWQVVGNHREMDVCITVFCLTIVKMNKQIEANISIKKSENSTFQLGGHCNTEAALPSSWFW